MKIYSIINIEIVIILLLFTLSISFYGNFIIPSPTQTDDIIRNLYPAELLTQGKGMNLYNSLNEKYNTFGFAPIGSYRTPTELYSEKSSGGILFFALIVYIFGSEAFFYLSPFFGSLCIVLIYFLAKSTIGREYAIISAITLFTMPLFIRWSIDNFENIIIVTFFLAAFTTLVSLGKNSKYLISGTLFSISIFLRPDGVLLIVPFILYLFFEKVSIKNFTAFLVPIFGVIIFIYPLMNYLLYNDIFYLGGLGTNWPVETEAFVPDSKWNRLHMIFDWFGAGPALFQSAKYVMMSSFAYPFLLVSLLGIILLLRNKRNIAIFTLVIGVILWLFYGKTTATHAFGDPNLESSFLRYMLPVFSLLPIGFSEVLKRILTLKMRFTKIICFVLFLTILMTSLTYTINYVPGGILYLNDREQWTLDARLEISEQTEANDVFITDIYGRKITFPDRLNIFYLPNIPSDLKYTETDRVIKELLNDNRNVYLIIANFPDESVEMLDFIEKKYALKKLKMKNSRYIETYKIGESNDGI